MLDQAGGLKMKNETDCGYILILILGRDVADEHHINYVTVVEAGGFNLLSERKM